MSKKKKAIEDFFADYEKHFNEALPGNNPEIAGQIKRSFAECFVESSPLGVICGKNDDTFLRRINQGFEFYRKIGSTGMNIVSKDITLLDDVHAMVKVYWRYSYQKDQKPGTIDFHVVYFLTTLNNEARIFAYVTGDEQKALMERGLVPNEEVVSE